MRDTQLCCLGAWPGHGAATDSSRTGFYPEPPHLVEEPLGEGAEALRAHKAVLVVQLPIAVDDALCGGKPGLAALAQGIGQAFRHVARGDRRRRKKVSAGQQTCRAGPGTYIPASSAQVDPTFNGGDRHGTRL